MSEDKAGSEDPWQMVSDDQGTSSPRSSSTQGELPSVSERQPAPTVEASGVVSLQSEEQAPAEERDIDQQSVPAQEPQDEAGTEAEGSQGFAKPERSAPVVDSSWQRTEQYARDICAACVPELRPQPPQPCHVYFKLLVVGEECVGKSTFIKNLAASFGRAVDHPAGPEGVGAVTLESVRCMEYERETVVMHYAACNTVFHYSLEEPHMSGWDPDSPQGAVDMYFRARLEQEQDTARKGPMSALPDERVDACLYFIAPHSLKFTDMMLMKRLGGVVPIIPVLAKADAMTADELAAFRAKVRELLCNPEQPLAYNFAEEDLAACGMAPDSAPPFAVIASAELDRSVGRFWPVRGYAWGACEALASVHSDVLALKRLLFERAWRALKAETEVRYHAYRAAQLRGGDAEAAGAEAAGDAARPGGERALLGCPEAAAAARDDQQRGGGRRGRCHRGGRGGRGRLGRRERLFVATAAALGIFVVFTHLRLAALEGKVAGLQARRRCLF